MACNVGFELSKAGQCIDSSTISKCSLYGSEIECLACQPTYSLTNGQCTKDYSACLAFSETDKNKCVSCGFGTVLQDGKCIGAINCETP